MRQSDFPQGKKQVGASSRYRRPPIRGSDAKYKSLGTLVADAAEARRELLRGVLLAAAIQQNGICRRTAWLTIQPLEDGSLGLEELGLAGDIPGGAFYIIG
jgi:hypothetical protein